MVTIDQRLHPKIATSPIAVVEARGEDVLYTLGVLEPGAYQHRLTFLGRKPSEEAILPIGTTVDVIVLDADERKYFVNREDSLNIIDVHTLFGVRVQPDSPYFDAYRSKKLPWLATGVVYDATDEGNRDVILNHPAPIPRTERAYRLLYSDAKDTRTDESMEFIDILRRVKDRMTVTQISAGMQVPRTCADLVECRSF